MSGQVWKLSSAIFVGQWPFEIFTPIGSHVNENKRSMGLAILLVACAWPLALTIQLSFMLNGHVAEVKYLVFKVQVYLYSSVSLQDQNPIMTLNTKRAKGLYTCVQLSPTSKFLSAFLYGHLFSSYRPFRDIISAPKDHKMTFEH